jgi:hypothetical protein
VHGCREHIGALGGGAAVALQVQDSRRECKWLCITSRAPCRGIALMAAYKTL